MHLLGEQLMCRFSTFLREGRVTIAVIGHGRSPEGRGWGPRIDACDIVVRCWDWQWQPIADYGVKYDYGLFVLTKRNLRLFNKLNQRQPFRGWLAYVGKPTDGDLPEHSIVINIDKWRLMAERMGGLGLSGKLTLTRGCAMAAWAIEYAVPNESVILVGFDNVRVGINQPIEQSFSPEYWALYTSYSDDKKARKSYPTGGAKTATHDMSVEKPLLLTLAETHRVNLSFAQEVWS